MGAGLEQHESALIGGFKILKKSRKIELRGRRARLIDVPILGHLEPTVGEYGVMVAPGWVGNEGLLDRTELGVHLPSHVKCTGTREGLKTAHLPFGRLLSVELIAKGELLRSLQEASVTSQGKIFVDPPWVLMESRFGAEGRVSVGGGRREKVDVGARKGRSRPHLFLASLTASMTRGFPSLSL